MLSREALSSERRHFFEMPFGVTERVNRPATLTFDRRRARRLESPGDTGSRAGVPDGCARLRTFST
jgi:hypothetical protein